MRHGPHHEAQKSTRTGTLAPATISSNELASTSMGSLTADRGAWQAPQRPMSAKCLTGTLFFVPQDSQGDTIEKPTVTWTSRVNFQHVTGQACSYACSCFR
jgi:hypothetical protein